MGLGIVAVLASAALAAAVPPFPPDSQQPLERTCFQTGQAYSELGNLRSDVAIVYGIDAGLPQRIQTWRDRGYRIHVMTGVSWGQYQDYLYGRFDGVNHEDEAQSERNGKKISHGGDVYYMCPGTNYGKFLCVGVQRALDAGAEAIHLEEPEFWVRGGYSEGFKREWRAYFHEEWQPPHTSVDAQWRASKLKYFLYRRALQQVFDYIQDFNRRTGRQVRCYVPTHSLLNYAHWRIVSPESSLARLAGCDGYIAQVWTGTARTPNVFRGRLRERTFETAFLEYGAMQNLVRTTGRRVWFLNDPIEDDPKHDWEDYRANWESTLTASLFQAGVWRYEVAPWPERVFGGRYPHGRPDAQSMPSTYATEVQTVMNALNDMQQQKVEWDCGTTGIGVFAGDSLMFQRGDPHSSDPHLSHFYGLALPLLKRGLPVTPVQLENVGLPGYLAPFRVLLLTYQGMKPLSPDVHQALADWVQHGGVLVICDDDADPYNRVREWWNSDGRRDATPREDLFARLGLTAPAAAAPQAGTGIKAGMGRIIWLRENPARFVADTDGEIRLVAAVKQAAARARLPWREKNHLLLRRGPYIIAAGLDESIVGETKTLDGRYVNLFDPELTVQHKIHVTAGARFFLLDLTAATGRHPRILASAGKALVLEQSDKRIRACVEAVARTPGILLLNSPHPPRTITLEGKPLDSFTYSGIDHLLWIRFVNPSQPRELMVEF